MLEYKVVPAPVRAVKSKGLKTTADRFANTLAERINAEAAGGWQFLRTESLPCEERSRFGAARVSQQVVMVFARELGAARPDAGAALAAAQEAVQSDEPREAPARLKLEPRREPVPEPAARRQEPLFRSGAMLRADAAQRPEPVLRPLNTADETGTAD
ncbi:DUF4177 domain-containing protein [Pararhodobacter zhoushanensis]|uniref:DUF4177 domain-containing protein n=1 Tax=Pararhodobacter zhoushanensis TaxID=2479545 RepID=A0ABT3H1A3_9RHOB|nr:DUF4177 domain-containing protein [Pararhodobacter zhoushanensis]MCW1933541.1 DUF4177 domain-containing protein [Pararhodobacter zhoushanensis]